MTVGLTSLDQIHLVMKRFNHMVEMVLWNWVLVDTLQIFYPLMLCVN